MSLSGRPVSVNFSRSRVYSRKDRVPVGLSASRPVGFSKWSVLIGRPGPLRHQTRHGVYANDTVEGGTPGDVITDVIHLTVPVRYVISCQLPAILHLDRRLRHVCSVHCSYCWTSVSSYYYLVGWCRLTVSNLVLKEPVVSALETMTRYTGILISSYDVNFYLRHYTLVRRYGLTPRFTAKDFH
jgi:hypothetical protein